MDPKIGTALYIVPKSSLIINFGVVLSSNANSDKEKLTGIVRDFPDETGKFERFEERGESFLWIRPQGLHHVPHSWGVKNFLDHVDQPIPRLNVSL